MPPGHHAALPHPHKTKNTHTHRDERKKKQSIQLCVGLLVAFSIFYFSGIVELDWDLFVLQPSIPEQFETRYGIIVDLGSSGSRVRIYEWEYSGARPEDGKKIEPYCERMGWSLKSKFLPPHMHVVNDTLEKAPVSDVPLQAFSKKSWPGVNELPTKPERVVSALGKLVEYAKVVIPEKLHSRTPIFILATAGLRTMAEVNNEKIFNDKGEFTGGNAVNLINIDAFKPNKDNMARVSSIIQYIRSFFVKKSPFLLADQAACRVASGSEEGIYSYVSLQHLLSRAGRNASFGLLDKQPVFFPIMSRFQSYFRGPVTSNFNVQFDTSKIQSHRSEPPIEVIENALDIGTIDMGGGSVQITFHTGSQSTASHSLMLPSQPDSSVPVFTHSFLGYGMYAVLDRFWWATILRHLNANRISLTSTPDLSSIDIKSVSPLFQVPSSKVLADHARYVANHNITIPNPCMVKGAEDTVDLRDFGFPMVGTGHFEECKTRIMELFDFPTKCTDDKDSVCAFGGVKIPKIGPKTFFFASDHARRIADYMRLDGYLTLSELHNHVNVLCESDARTAVSPIFRRTTANWTHQICFAGTYTFALLHHGFKIPLDSPRIAFDDYIDGEELNWGIGAFMQELTGSCIRTDRLL